MAVINYSGSLEVAQNFTDDTDRLREVVQGNQTAVAVRQSGERRRAHSGPCRDTARAT